MGRQVEVQAFRCAGGRGSNWPVHPPAMSACPHVSPTLTRACPHVSPTLTRAASLHLPLAAASLGDTATPLGKAVRILNNQLQALTQVGGASLQSKEGLWGGERLGRSRNAVPTACLQSCWQKFECSHPPCQRIFHHAFPIAPVLPRRWMPASMSCPAAWLSWGTPSDSPPTRGGLGERSSAAAPAAVEPSVQHCGSLAEMPGH